MRAASATTRARASGRATGEVIVEQQTIATVQGGPIPAGFNLVTTTALDASDTSPPTARFYVDKYDGIGIKSQDDGSIVMQKRINGDESMAIALTGAYDITDGRLVLGRVGCATSASVTIDFTQNGQVVGSITKSLGLPSVSDPVVVKFVAPSGLAFALAGSLVTALSAGCHVIAMPRSFTLGEHYDDHQEEITTAFADRGLIAVAHGPDDLARLIADYDATIDWNNPGATPDIDAGPTSFGYEPGAPFPDRVQALLLRLRTALGSGFVIESDYEG